MQFEDQAGYAARSDRRGGCGAPPGTKHPHRKRPVPAVAARSDVAPNPHKAAGRATATVTTADTRRARPRAGTASRKPSPRVKSKPGPPMTLGNAAASRVRLIVWRKAWGHQAEADPAEHARRYGAATTVPDWRKRLVRSRCGGRQIDMLASGRKVAKARHQFTRVSVSRISRRGSGISITSVRSHSKNPAWHEVVEREYDRG